MFIRPRRTLCYLHVEVTPSLHLQLPDSEMLKRISLTKGLFVVHNVYDSYVTKSSLLQPAQPIHLGTLSVYSFIFITNFILILFYFYLYLNNFINAMQAGVGGYC